MLHLFLGDVGSGKTTACLSEIRMLSEKNKPSFLVVPEQETVLAETLSAEHLPPTAAKMFEVSNFTRLANTVFRTYGGLALRYATPADKALVMHKTLRALSPYLHQKPTRFDAGWIMGQLDGIRALHLTATSTEDLELASKTTQNKHLKEKLEDLSLVYGFYRESLGEKYADAEDDLTQLAQLLQQHRTFAGTAFYIDSFHSFTEQQYRVLRAILPFSDVTITLTLPYEVRNRYRQNQMTSRDSSASVSNLCFAEIADTYRKLYELAKELGVPVKEKDFGENKRQKNPVLLHVAKHLWRPDYRQIMPLPKGMEGVTVMETEDPFEAADFVASDILSRVREGMQFGDFAIVAGDATAYAGILDVALARAGIPHFLSVPTNISVYEPIKMMAAAYSTITGGFQRKDLLAYLKCGLCDVTEEEIDAFELYTDTWHIEGKDLLSKKTWRMHPNGFGKAETPYSKSVLEGVEKTKAALREQLSPLMEACQAPRTVAEHCRYLTEFLLQSKVEEKLKERKEQLLAEGETAIAADYSRLWVFICNALDSLYQTLGDDIMPADLFKELLKLTMEVSDIGRIPPARDEVTIGSASTLRTENKKHFYLFGVAEEVFPGKAETSRLFNEAEAAELSRMGLAFLPNMQIRLQKELFYFYRALSAPTEDATLVYFAYDAGRNTTVPSDAMARVKHLAGENLRIRLPEQEEADFFFQSPNSALSRLGTVLDTVGGQTLLSWYASHPAYALKAKMAGNSLLCDSASLSRDTCKSLWNGKLALSQSKIDSFVKCPFSYHQKYVLHLSENEQADFGSKEIGTFIHDLLEHFLSSHDIAKPLSPQELRELTEKAAADYLRRITPEGYRHTAQMKHIFTRLCNSTTLILRSITDEFAQSDFRPVLFELPIGFPGSPHLDALSFTLPDGNAVTLRGYIDRVDAFTRDGDIYVRVLDYKTGSKVFKEKDLELGMNLQLLLYLNALLHADGNMKVKLGGTEDSQIFPAGILYFNCSPGYIKSDTPMDEEKVAEEFNKGMKRSGLFLADKSILDAMEHDIQGKYTPIKQSAKPSKETGEREIYKSHQVFLKSLEEWEALFRELNTVIAKIAGEMLSGKAEAKPLQIGQKAVCSYCAYKPQCRNADLA